MPDPEDEGWRTGRRRRSRPPSGTDQRQPGMHLRAGSRSCRLRLLGSLHRARSRKMDHAIRMAYRSLGSTIRRRAIQEGNNALVKRCSEIFYRNTPASAWWGRRSRHPAMSAEPCSPALTWTSSAETPSRFPRCSSAGSREDRCSAKRSRWKTLGGARVQADGRQCPLLLQQRTGVLRPDPHRRFQLSARHHAAERQSSNRRSRASAGSIHRRNLSTLCITATGISAAVMYC